ncbi:YkgJ family cysteine cluster protein [Sulfolobus sp. E11-6]|uniref:YkgJ family cysteine cluster protein n=1 Tax=Sulfolobus sp. E11-6 TaxID=2663020 RepID=UPI001295B90C|nr:YkgJ family cysteine cluster protein [Sulfolobus sp. E11-6]QGA68310.1 YkgJ family cysteine cluster protein [Sulfolobus sp. E11-6]
MRINVDQINLMTKKGLRGDLNSFERLLEFLEKYEHSPVVKYGMYSLVFQIAMNKFIDVSKYCEECGGKCCQIGYPVPVYRFDYEELRDRLDMDDLKKFEKVDNNLFLLRRPCQFQKGWLCSIHKIKPYACLSYPFATEDDQKEVINSCDGKGIPDFKVPEYCLAGKQVKKIINQIINDLINKLGRIPTPRELYNEVKSRYYKNEETASR